MRLFLAITLPDHVRAAITRAVAPARAAAPHVRWVREESLHLTLRFLGERPATDVALLGESVQRALAPVAGFTATIRDAGAFPNFRRPRAVWLGMHPRDTFGALVRRLEATLAALGIAVENRPFRPHVTLGRVGAPLAAAEGEALARALRAIRQRWTMDVHEVVLMRSTLGPGGSTYTPVAAAQLAGAAGASTAAQASAGGR